MRREPKSLYRVLIDEDSRVKMSCWRKYSFLCTPRSTMGQRKAKFDYLCRMLLSHRSLA